MILYFGKQLSKFSSRAKSLVQTATIKGNKGHTARTAVSQFQYEIYKDRRLDKQFYTLQIVDDWIYYEQKIKLFDWNIINEVKEIEGYKAQKAITNFAGRQYTAWFTFEIPISEGPYKFNGLPGLILEIYDSKKDYVFEITGLELLNPEISSTLKLKKWIKTDQKTLKETQYRYRSDPMGYINNPNITIKPEVQQNLKQQFMEILRKENNPIEFIEVNN